MSKLENVCIEDLDNESDESSVEYEQIYGGDEDDLNLWNLELREMKENMGGFMGTNDLKVIWANEKHRKLDQIIHGKT